jgi:hypothetical protein
MQFEDDLALPRAGVGLFLCREVARLHGGTLAVSDQALVSPALTMEFLT